MEGQDRPSSSAMSALLKAGEPETTLVGDGSSAGPQKTPQQLLEKLSSLCFFRQEGLWTYEVSKCPPRAGGYKGR